MIDVLSTLRDFEESTRQKTVSTPIAPAIPTDAQDSHHLIRSNYM